MRGRVVWFAEGPIAEIVADNPTGASNPLRAAAPITGIGNPTRVTSNALANSMPLTHLNEKNSRLAY